MTTSPTLGLTLMTASQAAKEVLFNEFLLAFDSLYRGVVISSTLTSPPGSPSEGDCYIIAGSPTGAWSGQANNITFYFNGWQFITAKNEMRLYDEGSSCWRVYHSGSSTWDAEPASTVSVLDDLTNVEGTPTDGQVLTYRTSDSHWKPQTPVGDGPSMLGVNVQTASYTLVLSDAGKLVTITDATANNLTIPLNSSVAFPVDTVIEVQQGGAGTTTLVATAGVTLVSLGGVLALPGQYAIARLVKTATNVWTAVLSGTATAGILTGLTDVNITTGSGVDGYLVYWNNTAGKFELKAAAAGALSGLTDVTVTEGSGIDGFVLYWNNSATKWEAKALSAANVSGLATVATSGAYGDLTGTPSLASVATSGAYSDLSGTPSLSAVAISGAYSDLSGTPSLAPVATSGSYGDLSGAPSYAAVATSGNYSDLVGTPSYATVATSGNYSDLSGTPSLAPVATSGAYSDLTGTPSSSSYNFVDLGDVSITEGSGVDGYVVYWNNGAGKYELKAPAGGSTSLAGDSDVSFSTLSAHELLVYGGSTWGNETLTALIDATFGSSQGDILYRGSSGWTVLAPGTSGNYLMTQGSGANPVWDTVTAAGDGPSMFGINVQTGDYTLVLTDAGKIIDMRAGSTSTLTVPPNSSVAFPVGTVIQVHSGNTGIVTIAEGSGVDIHAPAGLVFPAKYFTATLTKNYTDVWSLQIANLSLLQQSADVSMSLGSGVDGYVVYWNNGASKFELKSIAGGYTSSGTGYLYNGSSDTNWQQGINLSKFSLSHAGAATSLQTVHGAGGSGPDGWAVGATGSTSIIETVGSTASAYVTGAGGLTIDTSLTLGSSATLSNFKLSKLNDVNVTEGSGIDGYVLTWNNATSKWIAAAASGGSTLAGDTDVSISSPTDGQVLTYNGSASKWENAAPSAGGGASPPSLTTFSSQYLSSGVSVSTNYVAGKGLTVMRTDNQGSDVAAFQGTTVPGTTPWTVTMQVRQINMGVGYLRTGMGLYDTSSTKALTLNFNNQSGSPNYGMFTLNSGMSGYANNYGGNSIEQYTPIPEWFQISFDGTTYTGAISWDGGTWFTVGTVTTSTLGWTATHIGMMIETYGGGGSGKGGAVALNYAVT